MKSEDALKQINYFQEFSMVKDKGDFNSLPGIFTDNSRLIEAAVYIIFKMQYIFLIKKTIGSFTEIVNFKFRNKEYKTIYKYGW